MTILEQLANDLKTGKWVLTTKLYNAYTSFEITNFSFIGGFLYIHLNNKHFITIQSCDSIETDGD